MNDKQSSGHSYQAVIWDLDGTLINSVDYHWQAWRDVMQAENFSFTWQQFVADFGKRNDEILRGYFGADFSDREIARLSLAKEESYRARIRSQGLDLLPGARHWLERLQTDGWQQALGTSAPRGNIDAVFAATGIEKYFAAVMSSEEVKQGKPAPDVFLVAAERMQMAPAQCIVVEDAPAGVLAGKHAGMLTVGVLTTHEELSADYVFPSLTDLPENFFADLSKP